jgi:hypothetical protein
MFNWSYEFDNGAFVQQTGHTTDDLPANIYPNEEVKCTEPSSSVGIPCFRYSMDKL